MDGLSLQIDAGWTAGLLLSFTRVGAFVAATPVVSRIVPIPGRLMVALALGVFLATPVATELSIAGLVGASVANAAVGLVLAFLTGLLFHLFGVAGGLIDFTSGLAVATLFDPSQGAQAAVFSRLFNMVALVLFVVLGGLELVVRGLALSVEAVPLDGRVRLDAGLATLSVDLVGDMMVAALELALPVLASLIIAEIVLGLAARFAPQANVFLLGLPAKLLITMTLASVVLLLFPGTMTFVIERMQDAFTATLSGLAG